MCHTVTRAAPPPLLWQWTRDFSAPSSCEGLALWEARCKGNEGLPVRSECLLPGHRERPAGHTWWSLGRALSCLCFPVGWKKHLFFLLAYKWVTNGFLCPLLPFYSLKSPRCSNTDSHVRHTFEIVAVSKEGRILNAVTPHLKRNQGLRAK